MADQPKPDESPKPPEKPPEEPKDAPKPAVSAWTYLNLALNAALILLCMFILHIVQDIKKSADSHHQTVTDTQTESP